MRTKPASHSKPLWIYTILPAIILNIGAIILFGGYYGLQATQPELVSNIQPDQVRFLIYIFIFVPLINEVRIASSQAIVSCCQSSGTIWTARPSTPVRY